MKFFQHDPNQQKLNTKIIHHEYGPDNPEYGYPDEVRDALLDDVPPQPDILINWGIHLSEVALYLT